MADELIGIINNLGIPTEAFLVIVILAFLAIGAVIVIVASRPVLDIYPYLQPNARVRARKGRLFNEKQLSEIIEADNIEEVTNYLRGFKDYADYVDKYPIEKALDVQLAESYNLISRIAPNSVKDTFSLLAKKVDISNIKSLIAAKEMGLSREETLNFLIPVGNHYETFEQLADVKTVSDIINGLDGTEYATLLEDALPTYNESKMVLPLESALDKYFLESILSKSAVATDNNSRLLHEFIGAQVDVANLKLIIRAKNDNLSFDEAGSFLIKSGYQIREWKMKDLLESDSVSDIVGRLEGTDYHEVLSESLPEYNEKNSLEVLEKALDNFVYETAKSLSIQNTLGVGPIISYLTKKENEIKNLKLILRAKREVNFSVSEIQEMLV
ncbi:A1AO ATPase, subunit C [Methanobrevibacter arboriphilus JCM 13429 = DSM 1125]|uniref:A-type ATP synthase subunit C n=1 Tax=Methanobrevibacter arboriphilus JCM 13429 = DSM 1125 TaxID=1300164 RepID=A0A1V6N190_METAZ|nr:V-type ATP synthase subunit C [Methanobrevibacter arboriphilus]OQD58458.1 A1AO ATPase, subunit C [Methanobrevibacter arboriphilus JCM 13429 = DSM 1125]